MDERHVILGEGDEILAIVKNKEMAEFLQKFLIGKTVIQPLSFFDFYYNPIENFLR